MQSGGQIEQKASNGNIIALANGELKHERYINPKIEAELVDFKKEIEEKFAKSKLRNFKFPLKNDNKLPDPRRGTRYPNEGSSPERDGPPPIHQRPHANQSSFINYQIMQL
mmetsp:Transcript_20012/g.30780  ORF Transcript_20012/g.30780 Transcript_20012/m.30780 type:complete len:111 (+) Transcript_20012:592-924(+)